MALYTDYIDVESTNTDAAAINNAIKNILFTPKGSLPGKPTFGSKLNEILFSPIDYTTKDLMKRYIFEALRDWEDRIIVDNVTINDVPEYNRLIATIDYRYRDKGLDINEQLSVSLIQ
jgi:phage baseplate assembly protein W